MIKVPSGWDKKKLEEVAKIQTGIAKGKKGIENPIELPYLRVANVQDGYLDLSEIKTIKISKDQLDRYLLQKGDVLLTEGGDYDKLGRGTIWHGQISPCLHQNHVFAVRTNKNQLLSQFFAYQAASSYGKRYFLSCAKQTTNLASINSSQLKKYPVIIPCLSEQKRIVEILEVWDGAIAIVEQLITAKQKLKDACVDSLITGKKRFSSRQNGNRVNHKSFSIPDDWSFVKLSKLFKERREFSSDIDKYELSSLTIEYGLIAKPERYNRDFLLKDKEGNQYRLAYPGDFVYNPMNLRWGAIDSSRLKEPVLISAYYNVLIPNTEIMSPSLLLCILKSRRMIHVYNNVGIGTLIEKKRVHLKDFLKLEIPIPPIQESNQINAFFKDVTTEIEGLIAYRDLLQEQKKGLMQKLLTGEWRVPVEAEVAA